MDESARVPGAALAGIQGGLLKLAIRRKLGEVPQSISVLWNHPTVFKDLMQMGRKMEKWGSLDDGLASLAAMAAAAEIGCHACQDLNYVLAHDRGLDVVKRVRLTPSNRLTLSTPTTGRGRACFTPRLGVNGWPAPLLRVDGVADSVISVCVEDGLVTAVYTVRNPHKLSHVITEAALHR